MGRPAKFTAQARETILQALRVGASRRTAARVAGINERTLRDWLKRGEAGPEGSSYRKFWEDAQEAEAHPRVRALGVIYNALPDRPDLAWKFIERREEGYAPPQAVPAVAAMPAPVNIVLSFTDASPAHVGVIDVAAEPAEGRPAAELPDPAAPRPA